MILELEFAFINDFKISKFQPLIFIFIIEEVAF